MKKDIIEIFQNLSPLGYKIKKKLRKKITRIELLLNHAPGNPGNVSVPISDKTTLYPSYCKKRIYTSVLYYAMYKAFWIYFENSKCFGN